MSESKGGRGRGGESKRKRVVKIYYYICSNLVGLYPIYVEAPASDASTEFVQLSSELVHELFQLLSLPSPDHLSGVTVANCSISLKTIPLNDEVLHQWWTLVETTPHQLQGSGQSEQDMLEMIIYSDRVAPSIFNSITSFG